MMDKKIDVQFDSDLDYIIALKGELVEAKTLMIYGDKLSKYRGACYILESHLSKYNNNLSENAKKHLDVDINELERKAVEVLVEQGHSDIVKKDLLKKYKYHVPEKK